MMTNSVKACPLCGASERMFHSYPLPNLYSEKMAHVTGKSEQDLLDHFQNVICLHCGIIYKKETYPSSVIQSIFNDIVPDHPKGWDVMSGRFSAENFFLELGKYEAAIASHDIGQENRYRRALLSIVDSIYPHEPNQDIKASLSEAITKKNLLFIKEQKDRLQLIINQPMPFKRFAGFSAPELWLYFESICGPIEQYDELGCPLWGLLSLAKSKGVDAQFVLRQELNYWGVQCRRNDTYCVDWLTQQHNVKKVSWEEDWQSPKRQLVGFFQYLDHLEKPLEFLTSIFSKYNSAAIILDGVDEPVYIQHSTGWTSTALDYVRHQFGKMIHQDFSMIEPSGNRLYLFTN